MDDEGPPPRASGFPPLPDDSPLQADFQRRIDGMPHVVYELRPFPSPGFAVNDRALHHLIENQYVDDWPEEGQVNDAKQWGKAVEEGAVLKSLSIAMMFTGDLAGDFDLGLSFVFPAFVVKHLEEPMTGGYIVNRMYLKDAGFRDFGWQLMYTPSASRWFDNYLAVGADYDENEPNPGEITTKWSFVAEAGFKFRVNVSHTPIRFLTIFTDYWGFRVGVKNVGFPDINRLTYVLEFGAGSF